MNFLRSVCLGILAVLLPLLIQTPPEYKGVNTTDLGAPVFVLPASEEAVYLPLDDLRRAQGAAKIITPADLANRPPRQSLGDIYVSGFVQANYPEDYVKGFNLYNHSHLLAYSLGGADIAENLFTGTHNCNQVAMNKIEDRVLKYIEHTGDSVRYEVIPYFEGDNLVCSGVFMNAQSLGSDEISISAYCYNVQIGIAINYANGFSELAPYTSTIAGKQPEGSQSEGDYHFVLNIGSNKKIHLPDCSSVIGSNENNRISDDHRRDFYGSLEDLIDYGLSEHYSLCGKCKSRMPEELRTAFGQ